MVLCPESPAYLCLLAIRERRRPELRNRPRPPHLQAPWCSFRERNPWSPDCPGIKQRCPYSEIRCASTNLLLLRRRDGLYTDHILPYLMPSYFSLRNRGPCTLVARN